MGQPQCCCSDDSSAKKETIDTLPVGAASMSEYNEDFVETKIVLSAVPQAAQMLDTPTLVECSPSKGRTNQAAPAVPSTESTQIEDSRTSSHDGPAESLVDAFQAPAPDMQVMEEKKTDEPVIDKDETTSQENSRETDALAAPVQCGCLPSAKNAPSEEMVLKRKSWCCYCCCAGIGCESRDPLMCNCDLACLHSNCSTVDFSEEFTGICGNFAHCCCITNFFQLPPQAGTPRCIYCNEYCLGVSGSKKRVSDLRRNSITDVGEMASLMDNRYVPCYCCCIGCSESLGYKPALCNEISKCGCCHCTSSIGLPIFPSCSLLALCVCAYIQCRGPTVLAETPCCVLFGHPMLGGAGCHMPTRCPAWCEKCPCNRWCACSKLRAEAHDIGSNPVPA